MAYSEQVLRRARLRLEQAKAERERENEQQRAEAYRKYPRLQQIESQLRQTMVKLMSSALRHGEDPTAAVEAIREENLALQREREWILESEELDYDTPVCSKCGGNGYVGSTMCSCLRELCRQEQKRELTSLLGSGKEHFDSFRLDLYPDEFDPVFGTSPRRLMQSNYNLCRRYAQSFGPGAENLLFSGATGLGKTFLSACIARSVADRGYSVVYETAIRMFEDFEKEKFGHRMEEGLDLTGKYLNCDLLIIDDLGTEMTTQFTISALYYVINSRMMENRSTLISTNLHPNALEARYSPQIASRINGSYQLMKFAGKDIRQSR